jgi:cobalt-zinc-cadmium resistance protein CzcA
MRAASPPTCISLGAVDFGILIDSAVVMVEALMVRLALHPPLDSHPGVVLAHRLSALRSTVGGLSRPILFSKAIIVLAFVPIFTFQRVEGKIFAPVAFTLSFALLGALLLTLDAGPGPAVVATRARLAGRGPSGLDGVVARHATARCWSGRSITPASSCSGLPGRWR